METKLKSYPPEPPGNTRKLKLLTEAASEFWDVTVSELLGRKRTVDIVWPRSVCMVIGQEAGYSSTLRFMPRRQFPISETPERRTISSTDSL